MIPDKPRRKHRATGKPVGRPPKRRSIRIATIAVEYELAVPDSLGDAQAQYNAIKARAESTLDITMRGIAREKQAREAEVKMRFPPTRPLSYAEIDERKGAPTGIVAWPPIWHEDRDEALRYATEQARAAGFEIL